MTIGAMSPRSTAPYQTLTSSPSVTSPITAAVEAMKAVWWIAGGRIRRLLFRGRGEEHLGPGVDRCPVLHGGMPGHGPDEVLNLTLVCGIIGRSQSPDVHGAAFR